MGRPAKFDRTDAVSIAMNEIWRNGYEANSVKSLSEKLGITRSSFYNAFGSREALFKETLGVYFDQSPDKELLSAPPEVPVKQLLTGVYRAACKARAADTEGRGCLVINSVAELCNVHDELGRTLEEAVLGNLTRVEALLERGVSTGEFSADIDIHAHALALKNLLIGLNVMCKVIKQEDELWLTAETTLKGLGMFYEGN